MSLLDAAWAIREAIKACEEAEDMIAASAVGDVLRDTLRHAEELLNVADEELAAIPASRHQVMVAAAPLLRARLRVLRDKAG